MSLTQREYELVEKAFNAGKEAAIYGIMVLNWCVEYNPDKKPPLNSDDYIEQIDNADFNKEPK